MRSVASSSTQIGSGPALQVGGHSAGTYAVRGPGFRRRRTARAPSSCRVMRPLSWAPRCPTFCEIPSQGGLCAERTIVHPAPGCLSKEESTIAQTRSSKGFRCDVAGGLWHVSLGSSRHPTVARRRCVAVAQAFSSAY